MLQLTGKVAIITGSTAGIGRATAELFSRQGASVVLIGRREKILTEFADELREKGGSVLALAGDVTDADFPDEVCKKTVEAFGRLDILVNNAGISDMAMSTVHTNDALWNAIVAVDQTAVFRFCRAALRIMTKQNSGTIVNISSIGGVYSIAGAAYSSAKAAILGLTKNIAIQYVGTGIRCNAVCPGPTETGMIGADTSADPDIIDKASKHVDTGAGTSKPEDLANAILFFASDESSSINGQYLVVDKGSCI